MIAWIQIVSMVAVAAHLHGFEGSPNAPPHLVSIALNILPCKQNAEMMGELMRREEKKIKKSFLMQETRST
jgi:hypothetical protein